MEEKAVLVALKKYGALVADNGGFFSISVCPDDRFSANSFSNLSSVDVSNFEVVATTPANGGPRTPGAPTVDAGADQTLQFPAAAHLAGSVSDASGTAAVQWKKYSGPGAISFKSANQGATDASFDAPGVYTLMLSAADGLHAVAYDAVVILALPRVMISKSGNQSLITFRTASGAQYRVEQTTDLAGGIWSTVTDGIAGTGGEVSISDAIIDAHVSRFYRVLLLP